MGFWTWLRNGAPSFDGVVANATTESPDSVGQDYNPGDPEGVVLEGQETFSRSLPFPAPSPWSGWPSQWDTPMWGAAGGVNGLSRLVDTAWACIDLNASVLAAMPPYRLQSGQIVNPLSWMGNPDPLIYSSWYEFAKQLFWDYLMGEVFVLPMSHFADNSPRTFRVVPPWLMNVELRGGRREYMLGSEDVTDEVLHIRYQSSTTDAHGHGPLEAAGARVVASGLLQRYVHQLVETGGVPHYWLHHEKRLEKHQADELLEQWVESRMRHSGHPGVLSGPVTLESMPSPSAKDMALLELSQWTESRIAIALGVPPPIMGLPSGGDSLTYKNQEDIYEFHDRSSLRPKATAVMQAFSWWALPRGQSVELNRDEYSRPGMKERAEAYQILHAMGVISTEQIQAAERLHSSSAASSLAGGTADETGPETGPSTDMSLTGGDSDRN